MAIETVTTYLNLPKPDPIALLDAKAAFLRAATDEPYALDKALDTVPAKAAVNALHRVIHAIWADWEPADVLYPFVTSRSEFTLGHIEMWEFLKRTADLGITFDVRALERLTELLVKNKKPRTKPLFDAKQAEHVTRFFSGVTMRGTPDKRMQAAIGQFASIFSCDLVRPELAQEMLELLLSHALRASDAAAIAALRKEVPASVTNASLAVNLARLAAVGKDVAEALRWATLARKLGASASELEYHKELAKLLADHGLATQGE